MNLYSIYDSESGQCLGENKTAAQIEKLFGIKQSSMRKSAERGHICQGKYRIKLIKQVFAGEGFEDDEVVAWMKDWELVTENIRRHFRRIRREQERRLAR